MFWLLLHSADTALRFSSFFHSAPISKYAKDGQDFRRGQSQLIPTDQRDIPRPYDIVLSNKSSGKGGEDRDISSYGVCHLKKPLGMLMSL